MDIKELERRIALLPFPCYIVAAYHDVDNTGISQGLAYHADDVMKTIQLSWMLLDYDWSRKELAAVYVKDGKLASTNLLEGA